MGVFDAPLADDSLAGTGSVLMDGTLHVTGGLSGGGSATLERTARTAAFSVDGTTAAGTITFANGSHTASGCRWTDV